MPNPSRRLSRRLIGRAAHYIPLRTYRRLLPRSPIGFFYHAVSDEPLPHVRHLYPYKSTAEFEADLTWLHANTALVDYPTLLSITENHNTLPSNAAYLSFDDGFIECYQVVRPILKKFNTSCLFFLTTDWIDNRGLFYRGKISLAIEALQALPELERDRILANLAGQTGAPQAFETFTGWLKAHQRSGEPVIDAVCAALEIDIPDFLETTKPYLTREQILEMQAEGFHFGAHSRCHAKFSTLAPEEQAEEIVESCRIVADLTGNPSVPFAFPFSGSGVDRAMLREIRNRHAVVGPIFDTGRLRREPGIHHRIWADKPVQGVRREGNLAYWLHDAYERLLRA